METRTFSTKFLSALSNKQAWVAGVISGVIMFAVIVLSRQFDFTTWLRGALQTYGEWNLWWWLTMAFVGSGGMGLGLDYAIKKEKVSKWPARLVEMGLIFIMMVSGFAATYAALLIWGS